jgi:ubiquinone/menaquinone biosynthesis C-methylase UbiE
MTKQDLLYKLGELAQKSNDEWLFSLEERKLQELEFHNRDRDQDLIKSYDKDMFEKSHGNKKFYKTVQLSSSYVENWIKQHSKGKIFLDYASGNGLNAIKAAKAGAELAIGIDLSDISIKNARKFAKEGGVSDNTYFVMGDCENTGLPSNCIDVCICSGMLHHLDLRYAFCELRRILKPGGVILARESLDYNPLIRLYRKLTPQMRTEWEAAHILTYKDLEFAKGFFVINEIRHWHLFSILGAYMPFALPFLNLMDSFILKFPLIKKISWMLTFELQKKEK